MYFTQLASYISVVLAFADQQKTQAINALRSWLGPAPQNYFLLDDGRILPTTVQLPPDVFLSAYLYDSATQRITRADTANPEGRFKPALPYLSLVVYQHDGKELDLSEWVGDLRSNPAPLLMCSFRQIVSLWSMIHNTYIDANYSVIYITSEGETGRAEVV
jgi:hypothetical protein